jgi:ATP-dependent DNA ligase
MAAMLRNRVMPAGFIRPCQPSPVAAPPAGPDWFHEIKHDGIRLLVRRQGEHVCAFTRNGNDWAGRYPAIVAAAVGLRARSFLIDGEAVVADRQGLASFELLRGRTRHGQAFCWAFDLLELDGQDLRSEPLESRKDALARLLKRVPFGLALNEHHAGDGPALFAAACQKGMEGIVSKRAGSRYSSGRSPHWLKAKNPDSAAAKREAVEDWGKQR